MNENILDRIRGEIDRKEEQLATLQREVEELRHTAAVLNLLPESSLAKLDTVVHVLHRFAEDVPAKCGPVEPATFVGANGSRPAFQRHAQRDLAKKTIVEAAAVILGEHQGRSIHYRDLYQEALIRGYRGRASSTDEQVERSWIQTLRKVSSDDGPIEKTGEGMFRLRETTRADGG